VGISRSIAGETYMKFGNLEAVSEREKPGVEVNNAEDLR